MDMQESFSTCWKSFNKYIYLLTYFHEVKSDSRRGIVPMSIGRDNVRHEGCKSRRNYKMKHFVSKSTGNELLATCQLTVQNTDIAQDQQALE